MLRFSPQMLPSSTLEALEASLPSLPPEEQLAAFHELSRQRALASPLGLAREVFPNTQDWPQIVLLDEYLVALFDYRMTHSGPVPAEQVRWLYNSSALTKPRKGERTSDRLPSSERKARLLQEAEVCEHPAQFPASVYQYWSRILVPGGTDPKDPEHYYYIATKDTVAEDPRRVLPGEREAYEADGYAVVPEEVVTRLLIAMRPRGGKSFIVTEHLPPWVLMHDPSSSVGLCMFNETFSWEKGGEQRNKALALADDFPWYPQPKGGDRAPKDLFVPVQGPGTGHAGTGHAGAKPGKIQYLGAGGSITGKGFNVRIADDLIANAGDADSEAKRKAMKRFYESTWENRNTEGAAGTPFRVPIEIMMGTRWHVDDVQSYAAYTPVVGTPEIRKREDWAHLIIPTIATEGPDRDPLGRSEGEMHPSAGGDTRKKLEAIRTRSPENFQAQYQGNPKVSGGAYLAAGEGLATFRTEQSGGSLFYQPMVVNEYGTSEPVGEAILDAECFSVVGIDMAATKGTRADYTAAFSARYHRESDMLFVTDRLYGKWTTAEYEEVVLPFLRAHDTQVVSVENITYGKMFAEIAKSHGYQVYAKGRAGDKVASVSASGLPSRLRNQTILFPEGAGFLGGLHSEIGLFPSGKHDDQVDALAQVCAVVAEPEYQGSSKRRRRLQPPPDSVLAVDEEVFGPDRPGRRQRRPATAKSRPVRRRKRGKRAYPSYW